MYTNIKLPKTWEKTFNLASNSWVPQGGLINLFDAIDEWSVLNGGGGGVPGGANTHVQFNNAGAFDGSANLTWSGTILGVTGNVTVTDEEYGVGWDGSLQVPTKNAIYNKIESLPPSSGDILNGGNTTGAAVTIGTNDAFGLNFETQGITRIAVTGAASTGGAVTITDITANTATIENVLTLRANSSGIAAANFGVGLLLQGESTTTNNRDMVRLASIWTTATDASRASALTYSDVTSAGALTERFRFTPTAMTTAVNYTIGNSSLSLVLGGSNGSVEISTSQNGTQSIYIYNSANGATDAGGIQIGAGTSFAQTSNTRNYVNNVWSFAPTSGTAIHNKYTFSGTLNQTGGASGIIRGINFAHTVTAVADYRVIEIADNHANAHGIYQTGALTKNVFVGKTTHGATTAPTALVMLAAGTTAAATAPLKFNSGPLMTAAEVGAVEFLRDAMYVTATTGTARKMVVAGETGRATGQVAANTNVLTVNTAAVDTSYEVSVNLYVTTSSAENFSARITYVDENNNARTITVPFILAAGTTVTAVTAANGAVNYHGFPLHIRCKASTSIIVQTAGTFTGCTYNVEGTIKQIA